MQFAARHQRSEGSLNLVAHSGWSSVFEPLSTRGFPLLISEIRFASALWMEFGCPNGTCIRTYFLMSSGQRWALELLDFSPFQNREEDHNQGLRNYKEISEGSERQAHQK